LARVVRVIHNYGTRFQVLAKSIEVVARGPGHLFRVKIGQFWASRRPLLSKPWQGCRSARISSPSRKAILSIDKRRKKETCRLQPPKLARHDHAPQGISALGS